MLYFNVQAAASPLRWKLRGRWRFPNESSCGKPSGGILNLNNFHLRHSSLFIDLKWNKKTFSNETCGKHSGEVSLWQGFKPTGNFFCRDLNQHFVVFHNFKRSVQHKHTDFVSPGSLLLVAWNSKKNPLFSSISELTQH